MNKEVISSLSGNEMSAVKGGTVGTACIVDPITYAGQATCNQNKSCYINACDWQTGNTTQCNCPSNLPY